MAPLLQCAKCGRQWPNLSATSLQSGCPFCLLEFMLEDTDALPPEMNGEETEIPAHIGPYTILEILGQGGMGIVYRARHEALDRIVALKVLRAEFARHPQFPSRFQREGQVLASLAHSHIVGVHEIGCEAGVYWLALEYVPGKTLRQSLADGPLPVPRAVEIASQLCDALAHAHARGIVHRDIKPENVLIDSHGQVRLGDFGIAKMLDNESAVGLTQTQVLLGTRSYMAPEQLERGRQVDRRADIYSLGVVLYEMLTGELPLGVFPPPSSKSALDPRLDRLVLKSLGKNPESRYQNATEFQAKIRQLRNRSPISYGRFILDSTFVLAAVLACIYVNGSRENARLDPPPTVLRPTFERRALAGHKGRVWSVAFAPDSQLLASASEDKTLKLWNPRTDLEVGTLSAFPRGDIGPLSVAFSHDGKLLATAGGTGNIRIWNGVTRQQLRVLSAHGREITAIAFAPNSNLLASASQDKSVKVWDGETGSHKHTLGGKQSEPFLCVAFSPDGKLLAAGSMNGAVKLWDPETGADLGSCGHARRVWALAFSPDGKQLATGSHEGNIKIWDLNLPAEPRVAATISDISEVWSLAFSVDGSLLISGSQDGSVRFWDAGTRKLRSQQPAHTAAVVSLAVSKDGRWLASGSWDQSVLVWDLQTGPP